MPHPADILLRGQALELSYGRRVVSRDLDVDIPLGQISVIIGANACGKSTLLRVLSRLLPPSAGRVFLGGRDIRDYGAKALARTLAYLPQSASAPHGVTAADLVARGRYPHQTLLRQWSGADDQAVRRAMAQAQVADLADRVVDELSGGQRQRVWLALVLAQETPVLLLDEPTTYLDVAHQFEVLELCRTLNRDHSKTLVMVLHDLNQAARYADHVIAMRDGAIVAAGAPDKVLTPERIDQVFGLACMVLRDPVTGTPLIVPTLGSGRGVAPQTVSSSQAETS